MTAEAAQFEVGQTPSQSGDFSLAIHEVAKGERAASAYLSSLKPGEPQRTATEALDTLAAIISGGICDASGFPWHQVRPYHGALAFSILREKGAPAHIEAMRCRADDTRKYQPVPEAYGTKLVQKIKTSFKGILTECQNLGFISDEDKDLAISASAAATPKPSTDRSAKPERQLIRSEVLAMQAACRLDVSPRGQRDALMISLAYNGALKTVDLIGLTVDHVQFDARKNQPCLRFKPAQGKRAKSVPLANDQLIALEDWLIIRGSSTGALFCAVGRANSVEVKRMTAAEVRDICDQRAAEAGVQPYTPNDLAKSSPVNQKAPPRRKTEVEITGDIADDDSALFSSEGPAPSVEPKTISFPYHVRITR